MKTKSRLFTLMLLFIASFSYAQTNTASVENEKSDGKVFLIHVDESSDSEKFFPKLYPIGFIVKKTNDTISKTNYFLGDFKSDTEARDVLKTVQALGYRNAFIVESSR